MRLEAEIAGIHDDDDAILQRRKTAGLREIAAGLLELYLSVHGVKDAGSRTRTFAPFPTLPAAICRPASGGRLTFCGGPARGSPLPLPT
jgi:hypothetical protein